MSPNVGVMPDKIKTDTAFNSLFLCSGEPDTDSP